MDMEERPKADVDLTADSTALEEARSRRLALGDAADMIEDLIARPGSDPQWTIRVADSLQGLKFAFQNHVDEVEHDEGLLPQLRHDSARLSNAIDRMYAEHITISAELDDVAKLVIDCEGDCSTVLVDAIREAIVDVLRAISRHRQRGADLIYEAYHVDIGGG